MAVLEIQFRWTVNGVFQQSVHYFDGPTLDASDLPAAAAIVEDAYADFLLTFLGTGWIQQQTRGRVVSTQGLPYTPLPFLGMNGSGNLEELQLGHTVLVSFYRNSASPNRKRVYHTGYTVGNLINGVPANGIVAAHQSWADRLLSIASIGLKVASYAIGRYTGSPPYMPTAFPLTSRAVSTTYGHMESREG